MELKGSWKRSRSLGYGFNHAPDLLKADCDLEWRLAFSISFLTASNEIFKLLLSMLTFLERRHYFGESKFAVLFLVR